MGEVKMKNITSLEAKFFTQIKNLCTSPGYIHAIAFLLLRDNTISIPEQQIQPINFLDSYSGTQLCRSEISMLIGLACTKKIDYSLPKQFILESYIKKTDNLLDKFHKAVNKPLMDDIYNASSKNINPFTKGKNLRESFFYSGDAAYDFQYKEFSFLRYKSDNEWFVKNKGFSIEQGISIISAIQKIQNHKINKTIAKLGNSPTNYWPYLSAYQFTINEIISETQQNAAIIKSFLSSFTITESPNEIEYNEFNDFNPIIARPIIKLKESEYMLFGIYSLLEAFYDTPFYWLIDDKNYRNTAQINRGVFTEELSRIKLAKVFGENHVFSNVNIYKGKDIVGEIDVLVIYGNRAIISQAKSKKLTINARKGDDSCLLEDFTKAIQNSCDQAYKTASFINNKEYQLIDSSGSVIKIIQEFTEIYPLCILSESYPSLNIQARQFLIYQETDIISAPFITDIFFLDIFCELIQSPINFLYYLKFRSNQIKNIFASSEATIFAYYLAGNLITDSDLLIIEEDYCANLDSVMMVRRNNLYGESLPEGILKMYHNTNFGKIIKFIEQNIENHKQLELISFGYFVFSLELRIIEHLNTNISDLQVRYKNNPCAQHVHMSFPERHTGFTIVCSNEGNYSSEKYMQDLCIQGKNLFHAQTWYGINIYPSGPQIRNIYCLTNK